MSILSEQIEGTNIHVDIQSSNLKSADYNTETEVLTIIFNSGGVYEYEKVPWMIFTKFRKAESQGSFFNKNIAKAYNYKKVK